jgi:hypothetical protein
MSELCVCVRARARARAYLSLPTVHRSYIQTLDSVCANVEWVMNGS